MNKTGKEEMLVVLGAIKNLLKDFQIESVTTDFDYFLMSATEEVFEECSVSGSWSQYSRVRTINILICAILTLSPPLLLKWFLN